MPTEAPVETPVKAPEVTPDDSPSPDRFYSPERLCPDQRKDGGHRTAPQG